MNTLTRVLVIILVIRGSPCSILSDFFSDETSKVLSSISSFVNVTSNSSLSNVLNLIGITKNGNFNLSSVIEKLNLTVDLTKILDSINVTMTDEGLLNLKNIFSSHNETNLTEVFKFLNVDLSDDVLNLKSLIQNLTNVNLTDIVNSLSVNKSEYTPDFVSLAQKQNLTVEAHKVTTEDGYILEIFHVPGNCSIVLLLHGILDSGDAFIARGNNSLVNLLAKNGSDVWVMNFRGNRYSRNHTTKDPDTDGDFWQYSFHEKGIFDLPAVIDYILRETGQDKLNVVGHSQGTATVFTLLSIKTEYNSKVSHFAAFSPVCYLSYGGVAITVGVHLWPILNKLLLATGIQELLGYESLSRKVIEVLCLQGTVGYDLCVKVALGAVAGYNPDNLKQDFLPTVMGLFPAGVSRKELDHYVQIGISDKFAQYNYGSKNIDVYGSETAPSYNLKNVTCNVTLFVSENDQIFSSAGAGRLQAELPNGVVSYLVEDPAFNHFDYVYGENAYELLYPKVINMLSLCTP